MSGTLYRIGNDYMVAKTLLTEALDEARLSFPKVITRQSNDPYTFPEEIPIPTEIKEWFKEWFGE